MADRTVEVVLKLTTNQFKAGSQAAQQAVTGLSTAMSAAIQRGINPLNARIVAGTTALSAYRAALQAGATATQAEAHAAQAATQALSQMNVAQQRSTDSVKVVTAQLADIYNAAMAVKTGYEFVKRAVDGFIAIGERAAQRERTAQMFENLSGSAKAAEMNLTAMRKATRYTLSEMQAMEQAIALLGLGLAETPQQLAQITQQVTTMGQRFGGLSAEGAIQAFALTISNQSFQRLDAFGLSVDDVRARVEKFTRAGLDAQEAFKAAFLEALNEKFIQIGGSIEDSLTPFEQYRAAVDDLTAALEEGFLPVATRAVQALRDIAKWASGAFRKEANATVGELLAGAEGPAAFADVVQRAGAAATSIPGRLGLGPDFAALRQNIIENASSQEELNAGMAVYNQLLQQWIDKMPALARQIVIENDLASATKSNTDVTNEFITVQATRVAKTVADERQAAIERFNAITTAAQAVIAIEQEIAAKRRAVQADFCQQSADLERQRGREAQLEALRAGWALIDAERQQAQQRAQIQTQYQKAVLQAAEQFARAQAQAAQQYARQQEDIERQYRERLTDIQRQYEEDEWEAVLNRDAAALYRAQRRRDQELFEAQRDRDEQQQQAAQTYQDALAAAQQARAESLAQAEQARAESLANLEASIQEELMTRRRAEERARQEQALQLAWQEQDRQIYLQRRYMQIVNEYAAELQAARNYYANLARLEQASHMNIAPVQTGTSRPTRPTAYAEGGYTVGGLAILHPGEFVLNPQTTRRLEVAVGGRLTQQNVLGGINVAVNGIGLGARDVARIAGAQVEAHLLQVLGDVA